MRRSPAIAVLGPTGVGKTEVAILLSESFQGEIISCDSVQLYQHLDIGSAKPSKQELQRVRHHLIDGYPPDFQIDVGIYKQEAEKAIADIESRGRLPVLAGGTGMYFNSLYYGLFDAPARDDELRAKLEERAEHEGPDVLYTELREKDPAAASKIMPKDKRRIVRALEVCMKAGRPISELRADNKKLDLDWFVICLDRDREELYGRIEARVDRMLEQGLVEETRAVMDQYGRGAFALGSIGYRHARDYIEGALTFEEMVYELKLDTRHYAKRQLTWFRKVSGARWYSPERIDDIKKDVLQFMNGETGRSR